MPRVFLRRHALYRNSSEDGCGKQNKVSESPLLAIAGLTRTGLLPVTLTLAAGDIASISGPSGSGKSLLLRAIADLDPNEGAVFLSDTPRESLSGPDWRKHVAYVPAESGWWGERVGTHMSTPDDAVPFLERLGLSADALTWLVSRLSTGEKQRLALVRALILSPKILLLDEPTAGLDPTATRQTETLIKETCAAGACAVVVSHDPTQPDRLGAQRYAMNNGTLSAGGAA